MRTADAEEPEIIFGSHVSGRLQKAGNTYPYGLPDCRGNLTLPPDLASLIEGDKNP